MMLSREKGNSGVFAAPANPYQVSRWSGATPSETEEEAHVRVQAMDKALKRSKEIDAFLLEGKKALERRKRAVKILLLGQSESGKSSVLKNFQLAFAPKHFESERPIWKIVIQLNIISSIKTILEALKEEYEPENSQPTSSTSSPAPPRFLRRIRLFMSPLFFIEANLLRILAPYNANSKDMSVRAGHGWKELLRSGTNPYPSSPDRELGERKTHSMLSQENDPTSILAAQRDEILTLWEDSNVQDILRRRRPGFPESPGFFMNDITRIATTSYVPTDSDIIRARMKTMGVEEHQFTVEKGTDVNSEFFITDVGGTRHQRASWAPYFDDVQAILFLAPLAFNQILEEDSKVNRLQDSLYLWRDICGNKLLANAHLILFFNKKDVLAATVAAGAKLKKYVPAYGDLPNDVENITKYFKDKFRSYHRKMSPEPRPFMCYETSAIDIKSMSVLLIGVRESILRQHLKDGEMI